MNILESKPEQRLDSSIEGIRQLVIGRLRSLLRRLSDSTRVSGGIDDLRTLLESLPLIDAARGQNL